MRCGQTLQRACSCLSRSNMLCLRVAPARQRAGSNKTWWLLQLVNSWQLHAERCGSMHNAARAMLTPAKHITAMQGCKRMYRRGGATACWACLCMLAPARSQCRPGRSDGALGRRCPVDAHGCDAARLNKFERGTGQLYAAMRLQSQHGAGMARVVAMARAARRLHPHTKSVCTSGVPAFAAAL